MYKFIRYVYRAFVPQFDTIELTVTRVNDPKYGWGFNVSQTQGIFQPDHFVEDVFDLSYTFAHYIHTQYGGRIGRDKIHEVAAGFIALRTPFYGRFKIKHGHFIDVIINTYDQKNVRNVPIHIA